jgi:hypothetical protein
VSWSHPVSPLPALPEHPRRKPATSWTRRRSWTCRR